MTEPTLPAPDRPGQAWRDLGRRIAGVTPKQAARLLLAALALAVGILVAVASWPALLPFVVGGVIAYTVLPLVNALDRVMPRLLAALTGVLLALALLAGVIYVIVPPLMTELLRLIDTLPGKGEIETLRNQILADPSFQQLPRLIQAQLLGSFTLALGRLQPAAEGIIPALLRDSPIRTLVSTFGSVLGLIVLPTWALTVLRDQPRAWPSVANALPPGLRKDARAYVRIVDNAFGTFLRGQVVVGIAVGLATYGGLTLIERFGPVDFRYKLPLAVLAGLLQLIPEVGPLLNVLGVSALTLLVHGQLVALEVLALYVAIQWLTNKALADRFENKILDVHPAILVLAVVALSQFGPLWLLLAAPVTAVARDLWRYTYGRLKEPSLPAGVLPSERRAYQQRQAATQAQHRVPAVYRKR